MIFLYGPPGSGKSSLGGRLAQALSLPFYDLDQEIEREADMKIPSIFEAEGERGFRKREREALQRRLDAGSGIVALGGGALLAEGSRSKVDHAGVVLCLNASIDILMERLRKDGLNRPLLEGNLEDQLSQLIKDRADHYQSFQHQLNTNGLTITQAVRQAEILLGAFRVRGMGPGYDVRARTGLLERIEKFVPLNDVQGPVALITDETVGGLYAPKVIEPLQAVGWTVAELRIPPGEGQKSLETASEIWEFCAKSGVERKGLILALGGGVVGDLAGFVAATYLRGIPWLILPTTLLAMVDASLGGKTGVNLSSGKNLVGSFYAPRAVLADMQVLDTLPEIEVRNGLAEVVKHSVIGDPILFQICERGEGIGGQMLEMIVPRAMAVKINIIQLDPYEGDIRESLNFGHTIGHAVEAASDFTIPHGEAVAIGMVAEARLSEALGYSTSGLTGRLVGTLSRMGISTEIPPWLDQSRMLEALQFDKKRLSGTLRFALPLAIGQVKTGIEVDPQDLEEIRG